MKPVKPIRQENISGMKLRDLSKIVDSVTVPELKETEKEVQRALKGWGK